MEETKKRPLFIWTRQEFTNSWNIFNVKKIVDKRKLLNACNLSLTVLNLRPVSVANERHPQVSIQTPPYRVTLKRILWTANLKTGHKVKSAGREILHWKIKSYIQKRHFFLRFKKHLNLASRKRTKKTETIHKVKLRKTSQINGMVKTWGIARNRLALLINFYLIQWCSYLFIGFVLLWKNVNTFLSKNRFCVWLLHLDSSYCSCVLFTLWLLIFV